MVCGGHCCVVCHFRKRCASVRGLFTRDERRSPPTLTLGSFRPFSPANQRHGGLIRLPAGSRALPRPPPSPPDARRNMVCGGHCCVGCHLRKRCASVRGLFTRDERRSPPTLALVHSIPFLQRTDLRLLRRMPATTWFAAVPLDAAACTTPWVCDDAIIPQIVHSR